MQVAAAGRARLARRRSDLEQSHRFVLASPACGADRTGVHGWKHEFPRRAPPDSRQAGPVRGFPAPGKGTAIAGSCSGQEDVHGFQTRGNRTCSRGLRGFGSRRSLHRSSDRGLQGEYAGKRIPGRRSTRRRASVPGAVPRHADSKLGGRLEGRRGGRLVHPNDHKSFIDNRYSKSGAGSNDSLQRIGPATEIGVLEQHRLFACESV